MLEEGAIDGTKLWGGNDGIDDGEGFMDAGVSLPCVNRGDPEGVSIVSVG